MKTTPFFTLCLLALLSLFSSFVAYGAIRYVKAGAAGSGASWSDASGDLQAMIDASTSGDEVWIASGTYKPSTTGLTEPRTAHFTLKNGVTVFGGFSGVSGTEGTNNATTRTAIPSSTTLSGNIGDVNTNTDNCYHVFNHDGNGLDATAVLDGVVITGGNANGNTARARAGAGMLNVATSPTLRNCWFTDNSADGSGGGLYDKSTNAVRVNCSFTRNTALVSAGVAADGTNMTYVNCFFWQNSATNRAGGIGTPGDPGTTVTLTNCTFSSNSANAGQAISGTNNYTFVLTNCLFWNNGGQNSIHLAGAVTSTASNCLLEVGETNYTDLGNNQPIPFNPFSNTIGPDLKACAPAVNAGNDGANSTTTDVLDKPRKVGTIDIGAAEFQDSPTSPVAITSSPQAASSVCVNTPTRFSVGVSGTGPFGYQLYAGNSLVTSTTINSTTFAHTVANNAANSGVTYYFVVSTDCNSVTSTPVSVTVHAPVPVTLNNDGPLTCSKTIVTLTATPASQGAYAFSTPAVSGGTNTATTSQTGIYSVTLTSAGSCTSTTNTTVTASSTPPTVTSATAPTTSGLAVQVFGGVQYEWLKGIDRINGYEIRQTEINGTGYFVIPQSGPYQITVIGSNGCRSVVNGVAP